MTATPNTLIRNYYEYNKKLDTSRCKICGNLLSGCQFSTYVCHMVKQHEVVLKVILEKFDLKVKFPVSKSFRNVPGKTQEAIEVSIVQSQEHCSSSASGNKCPNESFAECEGFKEEDEEFENELEASPPILNEEQHELMISDPDDLESNSNRSSLTYRKVAMRDMFLKALNSFEKESLDTTGIKETSELKNAKESCAGNRMTIKCVDEAKLKEVPEASQETEKSNHRKHENQLFSQRSCQDEGCSQAKRPRLATEDITSREMFERTFNLIEKQNEKRLEYEKEMLSFQKSIAESHINLAASLNSIGTSLNNLGDAFLKIASAMEKK